MGGTPRLWAAVTFGLPAGRVPAGGAHIGEALRGCAGGQELTNYGYPEDVDIAAELDAGEVVPVLNGERFQPARAARQQPINSRPS